MPTKILVETNDRTKMKNTSCEVKKFPASEIGYSREVIPTSFKRSISKNHKNFKKLQQEMMNNGWILNDDNEMYFTHPQHPNRVFKKCTYVSPSGTKYMLPLVNRDDDIDGIGCSIVLNVVNYTVESNKWTNYFDISTRVGKRRIRHHEYLREREEKKFEFEEEEAALKKRAPSSKR